MNTFLAVTGALGGGVVFLAAILTVIRGIFRQVHATERNTEALGSLSNALEGIEKRVDSHSERISKLEGRGP